MTTDTQLIDSILEENERRWVTLRSDYDPVTGENAPGERVKLCLPDFAIPIQYIPKKMMKNAFIAELAKAGSIEAFLKKHPGDPLINTAHDVEVEIRRIRHKYDYTFWAFFCFPIIAKEGKDIHFKLNYPQLEVNQIVEEQIEKEEPIDIITVKARQWGGSTYYISKHTHILFKLDPYHSFIIAAHVQGAAENILRMLKKAISEYPAWDLGLPESETLQLLPEGKSGNAYSIKDSKGNKVLPALIYVGSAQYPDSLRSPAVMGAHYSEVGVWPNTPERRPEQLVASISGGILKKPLNMQVMESSAKSADDYFHTVYQSAKKGESSYRPIFIPWYHIPHDTLPIKDKAKFICNLIAHKNDEQPYGKWKDPGKHYWWLWTLGATLEGIYWYMIKRRDFTTYAEMANEAPSTDIEAFQASGNHVFDIYQVEALRQYCKEPLYKGMLISDDRRDKGVLKNIRFVRHANGNLKIWEMPDYSPISNRYVVSVDIGGPNPTSDYHSVRVMDRMMMMPEYNGKPNIVAEMHYHCKRDDLAYDCIRLAEWYNHALLVIESNTYEMSNRERDTGGDGSQYILDVVGDLYSNLYARESSPEDILDGKPTKWGFRTDHNTKPKIIDLMQWAIAEQSWVEPCNDCIDELALYISHNNKFDAPPHKHDDELMSTAINLWVCFKEMPLPKWITKTKLKRQKTENSIVDF